MWWALLVPACIYSVGVIVYAHSAFAPDQIAQNGHAWGSALMVVGGEIGTLAAASEVFRKHRLDPPETTLLDWLGLLVSLVATLGNLFVVYSALTALSDGWVLWARSYGPLALLLCSGLDFYAALLEFGFYNASYEQRREHWQLLKHRWEQRQERDSNANSESDSDSERLGSNGSALQCPICGANSNAKGEPFATSAALSGHIRWCTAKEENA